LGYVKLTRERTVAAQQKYSVNLPSDYFGLLGLLNGDTDGSLGELINLETFYNYDPKKVPEEEQEQYEKEKEFANKIEDIYNKHKNDQFTKQVVLNFGYFEVELPIETDDTVDLEAEEGMPPPPKTKIDRYPLFALPVRIEKEITKAGVGKYFIYALDPEVQVNIGALELILGEDLYFQLLEEMGKYEVEGQLTLPITTLDVFTEIWHKIKAQLRLKDAKFDEDSFSLEEIKIALSPRANYFLAEDLAKLTQLPEENLEQTSLTSWIQDDELNVVGSEPAEKDLYFPFLYDKYQISTLSLLGNKAAIIQGPPGTGKSETISNILCHLAATGKRVLFVSQKAQALKVVKDKLNKLDVKYLYGYLPNPNSAQIGEEDEADGIAPQLTGLGAYIEKIGQRSSYPSTPSISEPAAQKEKSKEELDAIIDAQRRFYHLHQELLELADYDLGITDLKCFEKTFSAEEWSTIKSVKSEIEQLEKNTRAYERSGNKKEFDGLFPTINFKDKHYAAEIGHIRTDVAETGYDRHSRLFRKFNNMGRNSRLGKIRGKLPRELVDHIDGILKDDNSRIEQVRALTALHAHSSHYAGVERLEEAKEQLEERLTACGVSEDEFATIDGKIRDASAKGLEEIKKNILRVQEIKLELNRLRGFGSANKASMALKRAEDARTKQVALYMQNIVNKNILRQWSQGVKMRQVIQKLARAFGKSKRAFKTFDNLRKDADNFRAILDLIPIWIMELDDASRIMPLEPGMFDYVILDEASQCNVAYTLPVMYRAQRTLFVGDDEQMRDTTIMFKSNRVFDELAHRYSIPNERQIKATGNAVQSVLEIAKNRGFMFKTLHYHYRSPRELIDFSNKYFYKPNGKELIPLNSNYLTYKDTNRIMVVHQVESDWSEEISDQVNVAEAKAIFNLFEELRADEKYRNKSIGILTFFNAQAGYIRELFEKAGYKEEKDNYKVSIIEGIQGDEKDIVIYSFVIRKPDQKNKYIPLTGEGGDIRGDINKGRVNVAFSRARLQVHCFVSMPIQDVPEKIWLKKYLEHADENGEVSFYSTDLQPFDSYFENEFYNLMRSNLKRGYKIQNQVPSCGFKLDFVISNSASGKRIAVECDGPMHFKDEIDEMYGIHVESDEERQRVLEAAGWKFCRIKYADWVDEKFDRNTVVDTIKELLK
jgi:very-short-patch-repair endonuclease